MLRAYFNIRRRGWVMAPRAFKFRAFLSYSHRDKLWGNWLHSALERYRIDVDLVGRETAVGPVPRSLRPIFRDRDDFSAGHSLSEQTRTALEDSQFLIVLCSPHAASSKYVNEEIRSFKAMGRGDRIIPVIVGGEPSDSARECFPSALRYKLGSAGALTTEMEDLLAADARPEGDDKSLALSKVVAGLLCVGLDEIIRRADQARRRHNRVLTVVAGLFLLLAIAASVSAVFAYRQLQIANQRLDFAIDAYGLVTQATAKSSRTVTPRDLLRNAETALDGLFDQSGDTPKQRLRRALLLISFVDAYFTIGDTEEAKKRGNQARSLLTGLERAGDNSPGLQLGLASAYERIADVLKVQGDLDGTQAGLRTALAIRQHVQRASDFSGMLNLALLFNALGELLQSRGEFAIALATLEQGLGIAQRAAPEDKFDPQQQYGLSRIYNSIGDLLGATGREPERLEYFEKALAIRKRLVEQDPNNTEWQRMLSWSHGFVGDSFQAQKDYAAALANYQTSLSLRQTLVDRYPDNTLWQNDLAWMHGYIGEVLFAQGKNDEALDQYSSAHNTFKKLATSDAFNKRWQRDLAWSLKGIGQTQTHLGQLHQAVHNLEMAIQLLEPAVKASPNQADWRRGLANTYQRLANALRATGDLTAASQRYASALSACPQDGLTVDQLMNLPVEEVLDAKTCPGAPDEKKVGGAN